MSDLKEKAKTLNELLWENRLEWDKWLRMGVTEQKQIELAPKYQEKWVRLEDVEELEQKVKNLETDRDNLLKSLHTCIQNLNSYAKESVELKQKLQQFKRSLEIQLDNLKSKPHHSETETQLEIMLNEFEEKFEELLKEEAKP
jgi:DNA repair exonuclease SbcCD ATPase subunit